MTSSWSRKAIQYQIEEFSVTSVFIFYFSHLREIRCYRNKLLSCVAWLYPFCLGTLLEQQRHNFPPLVTKTIQFTLAILAWVHHISELPYDSSRRALDAPIQHFSIYVTLCTNVLSWASQFFICDRPVYEIQNLYV